MKYLYSLTGANSPVIKEFTIDEKADIKAGELVTLNPLNFKIGDNPFGKVIGVCAENHSGTEDILNARSNGDKLRIDISKSGVYEIDPFTVTAGSESGDNVLVTPWVYLNSSLAGSAFVLKEKGENSRNTDEIGTVRILEKDLITANKCTFTLSEGANIFEGDVYTVFPVPGFVGNIASDRHSFIPKGELVNAKVVRANIETEKLEIVLEGKMFD